MLRSTHSTPALHSVCVELKHMCVQLIMLTPGARRPRSCTGSLLCPQSIPPECAEYHWGFRMARGFWYQNGEPVNGNFANLDQCKCIMRSYLSRFKRHPGRRCSPAGGDELYQLQGDAEGASDTKELLYTIELLSKLLTLQRSQLEGWR